MAPTLLARDTLEHKLTLARAMRTHLASKSVLVTVLPSDCKLQSLETIRHGSLAQPLRHCYDSMLPIATAVAAAVNIPSRLDIAVARAPIKCTCRTGKRTCLPGQGRPPMSCLLDAPAAAQPRHCATHGMAGAARPRPGVTGPHPSSITYIPTGYHRAAAWQLPSALVACLIVLNRARLQSGVTAVTPHSVTTRYCRSDLVLSPVAGQRPHNTVILQ